MRWPPFDGDFAPRWCLLERLVATNLCPSVDKGAADSFNCIVPSSEGERLIAFEAAMRELALLQCAAARYRSLETPAEVLLGELHDLGRTLRQAARRGVFTEEVVEEAVARVRRLRQEWLGRLAELHASELYRQALAAYRADEQERLAVLLPELFTGLEPAAAAPPLYHPIALTTHRRGAGASPFRPPSAVADEIGALRDHGLRPRVAAGEWWDTELPALSFATDVEAVDAPAVLSIDRLPGAAALFREGEARVVFTPRFDVECSAVLAESSDDTWYEATEGSYEQYRDALVRELRQRGITVRLVPAW